ncbi:MAG: organoarsenical effux MFS transporter ArsJ [Amphritea sp.]
MSGLFNRPLNTVEQYLLVTASYWGFTITDGALRMLVVLHFNSLGYSPFAIAMLFVLYEFFGVVTNLVGGWLGARIGLNRIMHLGLLLQIAALLMLTVPDQYLTVLYVMLAQALSGIAKDLNKMSAKSSIKLLVSNSDSSALYRWVALLTGSKNTLKGVGFFVGALLLSVLGFRNGLLLMAGGLLLLLMVTLLLLRTELGQMKGKPKFREVFSKSAPVNILSAARLFLFGARDIWFVVALPLYLQLVLGWGHTEVGSFLALWVIGYGLVQAAAPSITGIRSKQVPGGRSAALWVGLLTLIPAGLAFFCWLTGSSFSSQLLVCGLLLFGAVFAINSSLHSYLILRYARAEGVSLDVGFYYMSNAVGRLVGTILSGLVYQQWGFVACLWISTLFLCLASVISLRLPVEG